MNKLFANKKICIVILVCVILVFAGVIVGVALSNKQDKDVAGKEDKDQNVIVYENDENTVEKESENGLKESDSEDGPVLDKNSMIDFNGSDATSNDTNTVQNNAGNSNNDTSGDNTDDSNDSSHTDDNADNPKDEDSKDTGSWGAFY